MNGFFERMPIHYAHNALVYISGIILIFSIFIDVKILDNLKIGTLSFITLLYGVFLWICWDNLIVIDNPDHDYSNRKEAIWWSGKIRLLLTLGYLITLGVISLFWLGILP